MINIIINCFYLLLYLFQLADTHRYLLRQVTGPPRTSAAEQQQQSFDTQAIAETPSYGPLGPVFRDELLSGGVPSDSEPDFLNLFSDNATAHLSTAGAGGQCWDSQVQKSSLISSVASPVPPTVTVSSSASRGAANKRSRGGMTSGEPTKPAKAARVARPKKASVPVAAAAAQITGQYFNNCEQLQQAPPRVANPPLTGIQL